MGIPENCSTGNLINVDNALLIELIESEIFWCALIRHLVLGPKMKD